MGWCVALCRDVRYAVVIWPVTRQRTYIHTGVNLEAPAGHKGVGEEGGHVLVLHVGEDDVLLHRQPEPPPAVAVREPAQLVDLKRPEAPHGDVQPNPRVARLLLRVHPQVVPPGEGRLCEGVWVCTR
jgi:hypothetical protein